MKETKVQSLEDLQASIRSLDPSGIWIFRGQGDTDWDLIPSLYRGLEKLPLSKMTRYTKWISKLEHDIYQKFTQLVWQHTTPSSKWEEICLAQHYGVPTRFLDWTRHPFAATYFALDWVPNTTAVVWCFDITKYPFPSFLGRITNEMAHQVDLLNLISSKREPSFLQTLSTQFVSHENQLAEPAGSSDLNNREEGFLVILDPPHFDRRIAAQKGLFSLYYSFDDGDLVWNHSQHLETVVNKTGYEMLHKIVIPADAKQEIRMALEHLAGMNWHDLFPDLSGIGMYLSELRKSRMVSECEADKQ